MKKIREQFIKLFRNEEQAQDLTKEILMNENFIPINDTREDDIFIAGYPKSGNTWVQNLVCSLQFGIDAKLLPDKLTQELVPDVHAKKYYKRIGDFTFFKTHNLPAPHMRKVIHLVRDGRDVMASYYAMNLAQGKRSSLEEMIIKGKDIFPSKWHKHSRLWIENPYQSEILTVKYEDLINDTFNQLSRILKFSNLERPAETISRAVEGNSFKEMQRKEKEFGWNNKNWNPEKKFIRKGRIGSFVEEIPSNLVDYFENEANRELQHFQYNKE